MKIQTFNILAGTQICNAKCPFCISQMTPKSEVGIKLKKTDWINFRKACRLALINGCEAVMFTGKGEPLLYPEQITEFLEKMKEFDFPIIELQTNGLVLGDDFLKYKKYLEIWKILGVNTFVISIVHYNKERNREIYDQGREYFDLVKLIENLHSFGFSVRLNCILLKGYIDSIKELKNLLNFCLEGGLNN